MQSIKGDSVFNRYNNINNNSMDLYKLIKELKNNQFECVVYGESNIGTILQIDIEKEKVFVKLKNKVKTTKTISVMNNFANSDDEYHFEDEEVFIDEVWIGIK